MTGFKLASPKLFKQMWSEGRNQFLPFIITVGAIVLTDLLIGILIGLFVSIGFILRSNMRRPLRKVLEKHITGDVHRIELSNQVSFFSRPSIEKALQHRRSLLLPDTTGRPGTAADGNCGCNLSSPLPVWNNARARTATPV